MQERVIIGVYVDGMIITGPSSCKIKKFKESMKQCFEMTDLGILSTFLGIEIKHEASHIWLFRKSHIETILHSFNMSECNSARTLMEAWLKLEKEGREEEENPSKFRSLIGCLRYLVHTRPDITYSVNYLSRYMSNPNSKHMSAAKRILRYIRGTSSFGLRYEKGKRNFSVQGFSDSDFAGDSNDPKSTTGQGFFIRNSVIAWNTVKQNVVALSSCEAEYIAASVATCQGMWIIRFVEELLSTKVSPFKLLVDNKIGHCIEQESKSARTKQTY